MMYPNTRFVRFLLLSVFILPRLAVSSQTISDYGESLPKISAGGKIYLSMPLDSFLKHVPDAVRVESMIEFREEYYRSMKDSGIKGVYYLFDDEGSRPLYEIIAEYEDPDTLAEMCRLAFGAPDHPERENHWVISSEPGGPTALLWYSDNKMMMGANLRKSEFEDDHVFQLPPDFKKNPAAIAGKETPSLAGPRPGTRGVYLAGYLKSAVENNLKDIPGKPVNNRPDMLEAASPFPGADQTLIVQKPDGKRKIEALKMFGKLKEARSCYDEWSECCAGFDEAPYRLKQKSTSGTHTGNYCLWQAEDLSGKPLDATVKVELFTAGGGKFGVKLEVSCE